MAQDTADQLVHEALESESRTQTSGLMSLVALLRTGLGPVASEEAFRACMLSFGGALIGRVITAS